MNYKKALNVLLISSSLTGISLAAEDIDDVIKSQENFSAQSLSKRNVVPTSFEIDFLKFNNTQGFIIGSAEGGDSFTAIGIKDFNGDSLPDIFVGSENASPFANATSFGRFRGGKAYVIYGRKDNFDDVDLASLLPSQGFAIYGPYSTAFLGTAIDSLDFNGDGLNDLLIGSTGKGNQGTNYVIYGKVGGYNSPLDLANFTSGSMGFVINGTAAGSNGYRVANAGDFNNDGLDDILVGASFESPLNRDSAGAAYIIYGKQGGYDTTIDLVTFSTTTNQGFAIYGATSGDNFGISINSVGDINADGIDDIGVSAGAASPNEREYAGITYMLYGKQDGYTSPLDLASLTTSQGFAIYGEKAYYYLGGSFDKAGDFNHDGLQDIIISSKAGSTQGISGQAAIIFSKKNGYNETIDMLNPPFGSVLKIQGEAITDADGLGDGFGESVAGIGDINHDGYDDLAIGAFNASPLNRANAGTVYIIFGTKEGYGNSFNITSLTPNQGLKFLGVTANNDNGRMGSSLGTGISNVGDVNGDDLNDVIFSASNQFVAGRINAGAGFVFYGFDANPASTSTSSSIVLTSQSTLTSAVSTSQSTSSSTSQSNASSSLTKGSTQSTSDLTSDGNTLQPIWLKPMQWLKDLKAWWNEENLPIEFQSHPQSLISLRMDCDNLLKTIAKESKTYQMLRNFDHSLSSQLDQMNKVTKQTVNDFTKEFNSIKNQITDTDLSINQGVLSQKDLSSQNNVNLNALASTPLTVNVSMLLKSIN